MRCRLVSKEKEVLQIFQKLKELSENSRWLQIIRVKNRLSLETNDIMVNIRFNNKLTAEIQLQVSSKSGSKFSQCSNNYCHFIY